jgi:ubiquinone/menaquinone biosynthesis C-methylase UbiE
MQRLKALVPLTLKIKAHGLKRNVFTVAKDISFWPDRLSHRLRGTPIPSGYLIYLIAQHRSPDIFLRTGEISAQQIRDMTKRAGVELESFNAILDFGCGVGRVIRQWKTLRGPEVYGTDYNPVLINWCQKHLTFAHFEVNSLAAKLNYEDEKFDFIYALSVFTHLPEDLSDAWLKELGRVIKPGGYLYLTTHGAHYFPERTPAEQAKLARGELVVVATEKAGSNACATFHPEAYVRKHFTGQFEIVAHRAGKAGMATEQDAWLLRKA